MRPTVRYAMAFMLCFAPSAAVAGAVVTAWELNTVAGVGPYDPALYRDTAVSLPFSLVRTASDTDSFGNYSTSVTSYTFSALLDSNVFGFAFEHDRDDAYQSFAQSSGQIVGAGLKML